MSAKLQKQLKQSLVWRGLYFIVAFATTVITSRVLKAEATGEFTYLISFLSFFVLSFGLNLDSGITYFTSSKLITSKKSLEIGFAWIILISFISSLLFSSNFYGNIINIKNAQINVYECSMYYLIGLLMINYSMSLFYGFKNFKTPNIILIAASLIYFILIRYRLVNKANVHSIIEDFCKMNFVAGFLLIVTFLIIYSKKDKFELPTLNDLKQLFSYSIVSLTSNLVFFFVYRIDYWFVKHWCNNDVAMGNYLQVSKFGQIILVIPQILASAIFPQIANSNQKGDVVDIIGRLLRLLTAFFVLLFFVVLILGKSFFPWLLGESFNQMYLPMLIIIPGIYFLALSSLFSAYFSGTKNNKINLYGALVAITITLILSFCLQHYYTIKIAALISTISYIAESVFVGLVFKKMEKITVSDIVFLKSNDLKWLVQTLQG